MEQLRVIDNRNHQMRNEASAFYMARPDGTAFHSQPADWYAMPSSLYNDRYDQQDQVTKIHVGSNMGNGGVGYGTARHQVMTSRIPTGDFRYSIEPHKNTKEGCNNEGGTKTKAFDYNFPHYFSTKPFREQISWLRPYLYPGPPDPCDAVNVIDEDKEECKLVMRDHNKDGLRDACITKFKRIKKATSGAELNSDKCKLKRECSKSSCRKSFCGCCKIVLVSILVCLLLIFVSTAVNWTILMKTSEQFTSSFNVVVRYNNESFDARLSDTKFLSYRLHEIKFCFLMKALFGDEMKSCKIFYFSSGSLVIHARVSVTQRYLAMELIKSGVTSSSDAIERMLMNQIARALVSRTDVSLDELHLVDTTQPNLAVVQLQADIHVSRQRLTLLNVCTEKRSEDCQLILCRELKHAFGKWYEEPFGRCAVNGVNHTDSGINVVDLTMELMYDKLSEESLSNGKAATDNALLNVLNEAILKAPHGLLFSTNTRAIALTKSRYTGTKTTPITTTSSTVNNSPASSRSTETARAPSPIATATTLTTVTSAIALITETSSVTTPQTTSTTDSTKLAQATEAAVTLLPQPLKRSENGDDKLIISDPDSDSTKKENGLKHSGRKNVEVDFGFNFDCHDGGSCDDKKSNKGKQFSELFIPADAIVPLHIGGHSRVKKENDQINERISDTAEFSVDDGNNRIVRNDRRPMGNVNTGKVNEDKSLDSDGFNNHNFEFRVDVSSEQKGNSGILNRDESSVNSITNDKKDNHEDLKGSFDHKDLHDDAYFHPLHDDGSKDTETVLRSPAKFESQDQLIHNIHNESSDQLNQNNHEDHNKSSHNNHESYDKLSHSKHDEEELVHEDEYDDDIDPAYSYYESHDDSWKGTNDHY